METCKTLMSRGILPKRQTRIQPVNKNRDKGKDRQSGKLIDFVQSYSISQWKFLSDFSNCIHDRVCMCRLFVYSGSAETTEPVQTNAYPTFYLEK